MAKVTTVVVKAGETKKLCEAPGPQAETFTITNLEGSAAWIGGPGVEPKEGAELTTAHSPMTQTLNGDELFVTVATGEAKLTVLSTVSGPAT